MRYIHHLMLALLMLASLTSQAQGTGYTAPDAKLETPEDYRAHTDDFLKAADYLVSAPLDAPDRKSAAAFAIAWMAGTPDVSVNLYENMTAPVQGPDILLMYMIGYCRHVLDTKDTSELGCNLAGYRTVLNYYTDPAHKVPRNKLLNRFVTLEQKGKLGAKLRSMLQENE